MNWNDLFSYDPDTGELWWKEKRSNRQDMSRRAGSQNAAGYWQFSYKGSVYLQHRVIWKMVHGKWPKEVDHINRIKSDNRLENLRDCTHKENMENCHINFKEISKLGHKKRWAISA